MSYKQNISYTLTTVIWSLEYVYNSMKASSVGRHKKMAWT